MLPENKSIAITITFIYDDYHSGPIQSIPYLYLRSYWLIF